MTIFERIIRREIPADIVSETRLRIEPGDTLFVITDGVTEAAWASRSRAIASFSTTVKTRGSPFTNCIVTSWRVVRWAGPRAEPHHDASPAGRGWARGRVAC